MIKKTWMIHLPQGCLDGLWDSYAGFGAVFFMAKRHLVAIFADAPGKSWINFPAGDTAEGERSGHDTQKDTLPRTDQTN